jgi:hypothetical protein
MKRFLLPGAVLLLVSACQVPPERVSQPLPALPDDSAPLPYAQLLTRARTQAMQATEAFYVNRWEDLDNLAQGLEQTARFLGKAEDVPASLKDILPVASADLLKEARKLREAIKAKNADATNKSLGAINSKIREIRSSS